MKLHKKKNKECKSTEIKAIFVNCNPFSKKIWVVGSYTDTLLVLSGLKIHNNNYLFFVCYRYLIVGLTIKVKMFAKRSAVRKSFTQYNIS